MATPMRSTNFRDVVAPILNKTFDGVYNQRADEWKQIFKERRGTERSYHEEPVLYGFGAAPELPDGMAVTYQSGGELFAKRYVYSRYGLAFGLTKTLQEDGDHIRIGNIYAQHLAQSMIETKETLCANVLNQSFNSAFTGGDGVQLIGNNHPLANGLTASNVLATAASLSQTSLEQIIIQITNAVDNNGKRIRLKPTQLVVGPSNMFQAEVLTNTKQRVGTTDNDINPVLSMGLLNKGVAVISRVTSTTAWWVQTDVSNGLSLMMRSKLQKSSEGDFDTDSARYKAVERYAVGWTDWRDLYGTSGL